MDPYQGVFGFVAYMWPFFHVPPPKCSKHMTLTRKIQLSRKCTWGRRLRKALAGRSNSRPDGRIPRVKLHRKPFERGRTMKSAVPGRRGSFHVLVVLTTAILGVCAIHSPCFAQQPPRSLSGPWLFVATSETNPPANGHATIDTNLVQDGTSVFADSMSASSACWKASTRLTLNGSAKGAVTNDQVNLSGGMFDPLSYPRPDWTFSFTGTANPKGDRIDGTFTLSPRTNTDCSDSGTFSAYRYRPFSGSYEGSPFRDDYNQIVTISADSLSTDFAANPGYPPMTGSITITGVPQACSGTYTIDDVIPNFQLGTQVENLFGHNKNGDLAEFVMEFSDVSPDATERTRHIRIGYAFDMGPCAGQQSIDLNASPAGTGTMTKIAGQVGLPNK